MTFGPTFSALQNEGFLAQGCLAAGLTALRNAQFPDKATFYTGFFQLSTALERVLKLVLIIEHMRKNSFSPPSKEKIERPGHNLVRLYNDCEPIASAIGVTSFVVPAIGSLEAQILNFLSEFAKKSRYYNLDSLASTPSGYGDPLVAWDAILSQVLEFDVPSQKRYRHEAQAKAIHDLIENSIYVQQHGMDGRLLSSENAFVLPAQHEIATPYAMVRVFAVIRPALSLLGEIARQACDYNLRTDRSAHHVPYMNEFFQLFDGSPAEIRRKKRWP
ncbi:hypothetical protein [Collimonas sp.]|jgi:hypothetical protein|uniref:hypothetical protein n=1 Tax=Collimonas sp. TaxID=1963772 RepID=UPI002D1CA24C|nr:hypothetical protein [Collimonas sp.]HWW99803.1 hypothetical protein [Collimonas sp.]